MGGLDAPYKVSYTYKYVPGSGMSRMEVEYHEAVFDSMFCSFSRPLMSLVLFLFFFCLLFSVSRYFYIFSLGCLVVMRACVHACVWLLLFLNPFRTAVPFWGQITHISSSLSPKRGCGSKGVKGQHEHHIEWLRRLFCLALFLTGCC